jgi:hypothetical protein
MPKSDVPKELLRALELIRNPKKKDERLLDGLEARQMRRLREIFQDRNVVGIGIAEKEADKKKTGELSLCFYVEKKYAKTKGKSHKMIPPVLSVGGRRAVFTDVRQIGKIRPQINRQRSPIESGYSVGDGSETGTIGAIVKKGSDYFLLSSSHVLAKSGKGTVGDAIIYPGPADLQGGAKQNVAVLSAFAPFVTDGLVNRVDAALAQVDSNSVVNLDFSINGAKTPLDIIDPARDMAIVIRGRTSGISEGSVLDVHFSYTVNYPGVGPIGFVDQVACSAYAQDGDSGAIVVDRATGKIVGLHCGGSSVFSFFNPIAPVQKALNFQFAEQED